VNHSGYLVVLSALTIGGGCSAHAERSAADGPPLTVSIVQAAVTDLPESFESGGVVRSRLTASIASRVMAPVATVHVRAGDRVRRGAPLVSLDSRELAAGTAQAKAAWTAAIDNALAAESDIRASESAVRLARVTHDRIKTLYDTRSATAQELDQAVAALAGAEAQLAGGQSRASAASAARSAAEASVRAADVALSYAVLAAPFDGVVAERLVDPGSMAMPGAPLVVVEDPSAFRLDVQLDEVRAARIAVGQAVDVRVDGSGSGWAPARIMEVGRMDPASHNFLVKIDLTGHGALRSGAFVRARFSGPARSALTVPETALVRRGQLTFVFAIGQDGAARLRPIVAGVPARDRVEVLAGLKTGDLLVSSPPSSLTDGTRVTGSRP